MSPVDVLNLKGIAFELMYFKNTLDKLGVHVDVEHAGKYKDFGDMFTRTSMSPETNEVMSGLAETIFNDLVAQIAKGRGQTAPAIRATIDDGPFLAKQAQAKGLVDELRYEDQAFGELKTTLHQTEFKKTSEHEYVDVGDSAVGARRRRSHCIRRRRRNHHARRPRVLRFQRNGAGIRRIRQDAQPRGE